MVKQSWTWFKRVVVHTLSAAAILVLGIVLALRFWLLPDIDHYRADITAAISRAADVRVDVARISGDWAGLCPRLRLEGVQLSDPQGRPGLFLQHVESQLSWWSLLRGRLVFRAIEVGEPVLAVRRDATGRFLVGGIAVDPGAGDGGLGSWLLAQPNVVVRNAVVSWQDLAHPADPLVFTGLMFRLDNTGWRHRFGLQAVPSGRVSGPLDIRGELRGNPLNSGESWGGTVFAEVRAADLAALRAYVPLPDAVHGGRGTVRAWLDASNGVVTGVTADLDVQGMQAQLGAELAPLDLPRAQGRIAYGRRGPTQTYELRNLALALPGDGAPRTPVNATLTLTDGAGPRGTLLAAALDLGTVNALARALPVPQDVRERLAQFAPQGRFVTLAMHWEPVAGGRTSYELKGRFDRLGWKESERIPGMRGLSGNIDATDRGGGISLDSQGARLESGRLFEAPLRFDTLTARVGWAMRDGGLNVTLSQAAFANSEVAGTTRGTWRSGPGNRGTIDLQGTLTRGDATSAWRYVPLTVGEMTRRWLRRSLLGGQVKEAHLTLRGDLDRFPFPEDRDGVFRVTGGFTGALLEYGERWPRIEQIDGGVDFHGTTMQVIGNTGRIFNTKLTRVVAYVPDLTHKDEIMTVTGSADGTLQDGFRFIVASPVRERVHGMTDRFDGIGNGHLDLKLVLPLRRVADSTVAGSWTFKGNGLDDGRGGMPPLSDLQGVLQFTEKGIRANGLRANAVGGPATLTMESKEGGVLSVVASGKADIAALSGYIHNPALKYLSGSAEWKADATVRDGNADVDVRTEVQLFGAPAAVTVKRAPDGRMAVDARGRTDLQAIARATRNPLLSDLEGMADWTGHGDIKGDTADLKVESTLTMLGQPVRVTVSGSPDSTLRVDAQGRMDIAALRRVVKHPLLSHLQGASDFTGRLELRGDQYDVRVTSDLQGIACDLPAPLGKSAAEPMALTMQDGQAGNGRKLLIASAGRILSLQALHLVAKDGLGAVQQAELVFGGGQAGAPARQGIWVSGALPELDIDRWRALLRSMSEGTVRTPEATGPGDAGAMGAGPVAAAKPVAEAFPLAGIDLRLGRLHVFDKDFSTITIQARRQAGVWSATLGGNELAGQVTWRPEGKGRLYARLETLTIPSSPPGKGAQPEPRRGAREPEEFPALDIIAERFTARNRLLGRLELNAVNEGRDWRLDRLRLTNGSAMLTADGIWQGWQSRPQTRLKFLLDASDVGGLLATLGYPDTVKRGTSKLTGQIAWDGNPYEFNPPTLSGEIRMDVRAGQFLRVNPGVGKLLGLISLQSLPRRIKLDFRDIFSDGFAFDTIGANVALDRGVLSTRDFEMRGPAARASLAGEADLKTESQDVVVKVIPSLGDGVSLATAVLGGPVVGAATFIVQKILRNPLDRLLAYEYSITGTWEDPKVTKLARVARDNKSPLAPDARK